MIKLLSICTIILFISCNTSNEKKVENNTGVIADSSIVSKVPPGPEVKDISGCYQMIISKDTAYMKLQSAGDAVSGHLSYKRFEKDSNDGDFTGNIYPNGEVSVWYTFKSEGMISVRQSIFKIKENSLAEGYGDIEMKHDTAMFKYPHALAFEENHPFIKVNCP
ncbi:MAG: hypothetical protein ABIY51_05400 [Ferruginibacter sp.]